MVWLSDPFWEIMYHSWSWITSVRNRDGLIDWTKRNEITKAMTRVRHRDLIEVWCFIQKEKDYQSDYVPKRQRWFDVCSVRKKITKSATDREVGPMVTKTSRREGKCVKNLVKYRLGQMWHFSCSLNSNWISNYNFCSLKLLANDKHHSILGEQ